MLASGKLSLTCCLPFSYPCDHICASGLSYLWEQARYDPVKRQLTCHISLKDPQTSQVRKDTGKTLRQLLHVMAKCLYGVLQVSHCCLLSASMQLNMPSWSVCLVWGK